ncbi:HU family DNA-binding protein [Francisellaceae bacterium]|nr:HU family DNA-binding protein [Francisellaceae bacterium]
MSDKALSKADLAACLVENCNAYDTKAEALKAVDSVLNCIQRNLAEGKDISVVGWGKFSISERKAREGRNPKTGETIQIAASKVVSFKSGTELKKAVNN